MKNKALMVAIIIIFALAGVIYALSKSLTEDSSKVTATPTPSITNTANTDVSDAKPESSTITIKDGTKTERIIFHNSTGYTFSSYTNEGVTDRIIATFGGVDVLQLGIDWTGYTQGSLPLLKVALVKNSFIGNMYRAEGGGTEDGGYTLASQTKLSGKCTGNGDDATAPCAITDQIYGKSKVFNYLPFCTDLDSISKCDELMSGLEIVK